VRWDSRVDEEITTEDETSKGTEVFEDEQQQMKEENEQKKKVKEMKAQLMEQKAKGEIKTQGAYFFYHIFKFLAGLSLILLVVAVGFLVYSFISLTTEKDEEA
jgi:hypothetical protein